MRYLWVVWALVCAGVAWAGELPAYVLEGRAFVPARAIARAPLRLSSDQDRFTLATEQTALVMLRNRRRALLNGNQVTLPAPVCLLDGRCYLPATTLADTFGFTVDAAPERITLTPPDGVPVTLPLRPFPRPACLADETLAGLTPGDHLAAAIARWGDPTGIRAFSSRLTCQTFALDPDSQATLTCLVNGETIVALEVRLHGDLPLALRQAAGTAHGEYLGQESADRPDPWEPDDPQYGIGDSGSAAVIVNRLRLETQEITTAGRRRILALTLAGVEVAPRWLRLLNDHEMLSTGVPDCVKHASADLDGDGAAETITLSVPSATTALLTAGRARLTLRYGDIAEFDESSCRGLQVVDLDTRDGMRELAVCFTGGSSITCRLYGYDGQRLYPIATLGDRMWPIFTGTGTVLARRWHGEGSWSAMDHYQWNPRTRTLREIPQTAYQVDQPGITTAPLRLYTTRARTQVATTLPPGSLIYVLSYQDGWYRVATISDLTAWVPASALTGETTDFIRAG